MYSFTPGSSGGSSSTTEPTPVEVISTFASQSFMMYSTSPAVSFEEMQAK